MSLHGEKTVHEFQNGHCIGTSQGAKYSKATPGLGPPLGRADRRCAGVDFWHRRNTSNSNDEESLPCDHTKVDPTGAGYQCQGGEDQDRAIMAGFPLNGTVGLGTEQ